MLYLDTSVLLAYTLTKTMEPSRFQVTSELFQLVNRRVIRAVTSFYALHELLVIAISNTEPDWEAGSELAREALLAILSSRLLYVPIPRREDKMLKVPHAIAAHTAGCTTIVAYDEHFRAIEATIPYKTPDEIVAEHRR